MNRRPRSASPGEMGGKWNITEVPDVDIEIKARNFMKKDGLIFACLLVMAAFLYFGVCNGKRKSGMEAFNVDSVTKEEITDELACFFGQVWRHTAGWGA